MDRFSIRQSPALDGADWRQNRPDHAGITRWPQDRFAWVVMGSRPSAGISRGAKMTLSHHDLTMRARGLTHTRSDFLPKITNQLQMHISCDISMTRLPQPASPWDMQDAPPCAFADRRAQSITTARVLIERVVKTVGGERRIEWRAILSPTRECPPTAAARVLAMAVCCSAGIPMQMVARAFNRTWQTVDSARQRQTALAMHEAHLRDEFIKILSLALAPPMVAQSTPHS